MLNSPIINSPIRFTNRRDCIEVNDEIYKRLLPTIKAVPNEKFENFYQPPKTPAFYHYALLPSSPISLAIFPNGRPARYFIFLNKIPPKLHNLIRKIGHDPRRDQKTVVQASRRPGPPKIIQKNEKKPGWISLRRPRYHHRGADV